MTHDILLSLAPRNARSVITKSMVYSSFLGRGVHKVMYAELGKAVHLFNETKKGSSYLLKFYTDNPKVPNAQKSTFQYRISSFFYRKDTNLVNVTRSQTFQVPTLWKYSVHTSYNHDKIHKQEIKHNL